MNNLGKTVVKFLKDKIKQRYIIDSEDLFELFSNMGIIEDIDSLCKVLEHLEKNNIDVNFKNSQSEYYKKFKTIERMYKFMKTTNINKDKILTTIEKLDTIKPKLDTSWMEVYRQIEDEETEESHIETSFTMNPDLENFRQRLTEETTNRIISEFNQMSDEERLQTAMERLNELHNIINNNQ